MDSDILNYLLYADLTLYIHQNFLKIKNLIHTAYHLIGGENVARGSLIGALLGAAHGMDSFPSWSQKLYQRDVIVEEIDTFVKSTINSPPDL